MTKVLHFSTSDIGHGAGIAAYRLHCALVRSNVESRMLVAEKLSENSYVDQVPSVSPTTVGRIARLFVQKCEYALNMLGAQNLFSVAALFAFRHPWVRSTGVVHLHNIHWHSRNFTPLMLPYLSRRNPLVWTIHDMWPFTGHCYNTYECTRWQAGCGRCPDLRRYIGLLFDSTSIMFRIKRVMVKKSRMVVVTPSTWMKRLVEASPVFAGKEVRCIPNGVDPAIFNLKDRASIRKSLGIPLTSKVILFVASQLHDPEKGYPLFLEALERLSLLRDNSIVITMGSGRLPAEKMSGFTVKHLGYVTDEKKMAEVYASADVYVMPSLQDNLPNVVLEALACGTPTVCFDTGGLRDMVRHRENGYVARFKDAADLAEGIAFVLTFPDDARQLRDQAVLTVQNGFTVERMMQAYCDLYHEVSAGKEDL